MNVMLLSSQYESPGSHAHDHNMSWRSPSSAEWACVDVELTWVTQLSAKYCDNISEDGKWGNGMLSAMCFGRQEKDLTVVGWCRLQQTTHIANRPIQNKRFCNMTSILSGLLVTFVEQILYLQLLLSFLAILFDPAPKLWMVFLMNAIITDHFLNKI